MADDTVKISPGPRFLAATVLALTADTLQILVMPFFAEGALSPANDVLDIAVAVILVQLLGWHWEFLPALMAGRCAQNWPQCLCLLQGAYAAL